MTEDLVYGKMEGNISLGGGRKSSRSILVVEQRTVLEATGPTSKREQCKTGFVGSKKKRNRC